MDIRHKKRDLLFLIPNAFTVASLLFGFFAILVSSTAQVETDFYKAIFAIFLAMLCDVSDGRMARLTKTQSSFGIQLDSLADLVSFGVAPSVLVYFWSLKNLGFWGLVICSLYLVAGSLRLARFNVMASQDGGASDYTLGITIPLAALAIISLISAHYHFFNNKPVVHHKEVAFLVLFLSILMISNMKFRTFKKLDFSRPFVAFGIMSFAFLFSIISFKFGPGMAIFSVIMAYISIGILENVGLIKLPGNENLVGEIDEET